MEFQDIYQRLPGLVLGFHGCDEKVGEAILSGQTKHLKHSQNDYDWLGGGIYFWENDPKRALEFAEDVRKNPMKSKGAIKKSFVVGAVIDLRMCCNLLDRSALDELKDSYDFLDSMSKATQEPLPVNNLGRMARRLDCLVIETMHQLREPSGLGSYDTVRGAIWEGGALYPGAHIEKLNHVQIAVRNTECIKGYFRPMSA